MSKGYLAIIVGLIHAVLKFKERHTYTHTHTHRTTTTTLAHARRGLINIESKEVNQSLLRCMHTCIWDELVFLGNNE